MVLSSLFKKLFFPILLTLALSGVLPGSTLCQISLSGKQVHIFKGSLEDAVQSSGLIVLARPIGRQFSSSAIDSPMILAFDVLQVLKGKAPEVLDIHMPGQTVAFYPSSDKNYLLFLAGRGDKRYAIRSHLLETPLAFEVEGGKGPGIQGRLPRGWPSFTLDQVRTLIQNQEPQ